MGRRKWKTGCGNGWGLAKKTFTMKTKSRLYQWVFATREQESQGDHPPRPECAELWHDRLLKHLSSIELTLLLGEILTKVCLGNTAFTSIDGHRRQLETIRSRHFCQCHTRAPVTIAG